MLTEHKRHTQELLTALQDKQQEQEQLVMTAPVCNQQSDVCVCAVV